MKKLIALFLVVLMAASMFGCMSNTHVVGRGAQGSEEVSAVQWYALWGLVKIGKEANSAEMAGGASDYTIESKNTALDTIITMFTSIATIGRRTVTVTK